MKYKKTLIMHSFKSISNSKLRLFFSSIFLCILCLNQQFLIAASDFSSYEYSSIKQAGGITYEITNTKLDDQGLTLEGWAYIADSQHYNNQGDFDLHFMTQSTTTNEKRYYQAQTNAKVNMTDIEEYQGSRRCGNDEYKKDAIECNYDYQHVGFSVIIPITEITYPNHYNLFIFGHALKSNEKFYTQVYSPGTNSKHRIGNIEYEFDSDLDEAEMIVNNEQIIARIGPGKKYPKLNIESFERYFKKSTKLEPIDKDFDGRITWYKVPVNPLDETVNSHKLVVGSTQHNKIAYISSIYVNHIGRGYAVISTDSNAEFSLEKIMSPTVYDEDFLVGYGVSTKNITEPTTIAITIEYGDFKKNEVVLITPNETAVNYTLIPKEYIKNQDIKVTLSDRNEKYIDKNLKDNHLTLNPFSKRSELLELENSKNQKVTKIKSLSGFEQTHSSLNQFSEIITVQHSSPIDKIPSEWSEYGIEFDNFYAGGIFKYNLNYEVQNEYPYKIIAVDKVESHIETNCEIMDIHYCQNSSKIGMLKNNNFFTNPDFENQNGNIKPLDSTYSTDNKIYTNLDAAIKKHTIKIIINNLGISKTNVVINTYIDVSGPLFGANKNSLFYYRNVSRDNPMPNYQSKIWMEKLDIINNQVDEFTKIEIPYELKIKIKNWIEQNYQENINNNELKY